MVVRENTIASLLFRRKLVKVRGLSMPACTKAEVKLFCRDEIFMIIERIRRSLGVLQETTGEKTAWQSVFFF